jgi:hypothetical protein
MTLQLSALEGLSIVELNAKEKPRTRTVERVEEKKSRSLQGKKTFIHFFLETKFGSGCQN